MSNTPENRRITIYINGKEVEFSLKGISSEIAKTRNQIRSLTIGTDEYNAAVKDLKGLEAVYKKHADEIKGATKQQTQHAEAIKNSANQQSFYKKAIGEIKSTFSGFISPVTLAAGAIAGIGAAVSDGIGIMRRFEVAMDDLQAIVGLSAEQMGYFRDQSVEFAKRFGETPEAIIEAFKLAGSAKPELLESQEALAAFTEQALTLSKAAKMDLGETISSLTTIMNANGASADETARYINVLAAGSQKGAKEVDFLAKAFEKIGPVGATAGVSIEQQTAVLELLGEKGFNSAETAGTNFRNILLILQEDTRNLTNGKLDLNKVFENYSGIASNASELTAIFGRENVSAAQAVLLNRERVDQLTEAVTGTNTANEQAIVQMDNLDTRVAQLNATWEGFWASMEEGPSIISYAVDAIIYYIEEAEKSLKVVGAGVEAASRAIYGLTGGILGSSGAIDKANRTMEDSIAVQKQLVSEENKAFAEKLQAQGKLNDYILKQQAELAKLNQESAQYRKIQSEIIDLKAVANKEIEAQIQKEQKLREESDAAAEKAKQAAKAKKDAEKTAQANVKTKQDASETYNRDNKVGPLTARGTEEVELQMTRDLEAKKQQIVIDAYASTQDQKRALDDEQFQENVRRAEVQEQAIAEARQSISQSLTNTAEALANMAMQNRYKKEVKALDEKKKRGLISEQEYDKKMEQLEKAAFERKKRLDIMAALINGALAATKATATLGGPVNPAWLPTLAAIAAQTGGQIALIAAQQFGDGGMVFGPSHSNGGVPAVMEGGEYVVRKREVTPMTLPILESINSGKIRYLNAAAAVANTRMDNGQLSSTRSIERSTAEKSNSDREMFDRIDSWTREFKVVNSLRDQEDAIDRKRRVENLANVA
jgi:TP901 family phage tail tape measure protein